MLWRASIDSPIGPLVLIANERALCRCEFEDSFDDGVAWAAKPACSAEHAILACACQQLGEYFDGRRRQFDLPIAPAASAFAERVYAALRAIPFGQTRSYAQQARAIGSSASVRAVGGANARNPLAIIVPCHRVVGADGSLTGYAGGLERKRWLIDHERRVSGSELF
jgi:methylated-DNA-[protein]-cysteine S-methyltransferase